MLCEKCSKDHDGSYGSGRFCSKTCACSRITTEERRAKLSEAGKQAWRNGKQHRNRERFNYNKLSEKAYMNSAISNRLKKIKRIETALNLGKYEDLSFSDRRKILLKEVNYTCEICHNSEWLGKPIWLEIHHKDDNGKNNTRENLVIVCPNCHSVIEENYRFRGRKHSGD